MKKPLLMAVILSNIYLPPVFSSHSNNSLWENEDPYGASLKRNIEQAALLKSQCFTQNIFDPNDMLFAIEESILSKGVQEFATFAIRNVHYELISQDSNKIPVFYRFIYYHLYTIFLNNLYEPKIEENTTKQINFLCRYTSQRGREHFMNSERALIMTPLELEALRNYQNPVNTNP